MDYRNKVDETTDEVSTAFYVPVMPLLPNEATYMGDMPPIKLNPNFNSELLANILILS